MLVTPRSPSLPNSSTTLQQQQQKQQRQRRRLNTSTPQNNAQAELAKPHNSGIQKQEFEGGIRGIVPGEKEGEDLNDRR